MNDNRHDNDRHSSKYRSIDTVLSAVVTAVGRKPAGHDPRTIEVLGDEVVFLDLRPRRGKSGGWTGVNVGTVTKAGDTHVITSLSTPNGRTVRLCSDAELDDLVTRVAAFVRTYIKRLETSA